MPDSFVADRPLLPCSSNIADSRPTFILTSWKKRDFSLSATTIPTKSLPIFRVPYFRPNRTEIDPAFVPKKSKGATVRRVGKDLATSPVYQWGPDKPSALKCLRS